MQPHIETFSIRVTEVGADRRLTPFSLVNLLQEVAWNHAEALGLSVYSLLEKGMTWVLYRMKLDVYRWPEHREPIRLETYPSGVEKRFVYRDFHVYGSNGEPMARATSTWLLMDIVKRQMLAVPPFVHDAFQDYADVAALPVATDRLPVLTEPAVEKTFQVREQDLDANGHVNNGVYFQWLLETLPTDAIDSRRLQSIDVVFRAESTVQDGIKALASPVETGSFAHRLYNQHGKELVQALTIWT